MFLAQLAMEYVWHGMPYARFDGHVPPRMALLAYCEARGEKGKPSKQAINPRQTNNTVTLATSQ